MNIFEQVALEELSVEGEVMNYNELRNLDFTEVSSEEESEVQTGDTNGANRQNANKSQTAHKKSNSILP